MTSKSSKTLPFLAAVILIAALAVEAKYQIDVDLETAIPFLMAIGVGGAGLKAVERAAKAKQEIPQSLKDFMEMQTRQVERLMSDFQKHVVERKS